MPNTLDKFGDAKNYILLLVGLLITILIALVWASLPDNDSATKKELEKIQGKQENVTYYTEQEMTQIQKDTQTIAKNILLIMANKDVDKSRAEIMSFVLPDSEAALYLSSEGLKPQQGELSMEDITVETPIVALVPSSQDGQMVLTVYINRDEVRSSIIMYWERDDKEAWKLVDISI